MSVSNGQVANATTFNTAFISRTIDSSTVGQLDLLNADVESGDAVFNIQREHNATANWLGRATNAAIDDLPAFAENYVGAVDDTALDRLNALTERFSGSIGHSHDGSDGEGPAIDVAVLANTRLRGYMVQGTNLASVTGGTADVSTPMAGKPISSGDTVEGVPVLANNKVILRDNTAATKGDILKSAAGDEVYAKITNSGGISGTWTLTFYTNIAGVETAYSAFISQAIAWYYQQLYNPIVDAPIYSEWLSVPSDNATQDVIEATTSLKGKVGLASAAPADIASAGAAGTANATVANADHTHKGVFSFGKSGGTALFGAVTISEGTGIAITTTSNDNAIGLASVANNTVKGNKSGGAAVPTDLTLSDVTETGSGILTLANNTKAVVQASNLTIKVNLADAFIFVGNASNVPVAVAMSGDVTITNAGVTGIGANKVTLGMMAQIATARFLGRTSASTGNVETLTGTQATAMLDTFTGDSGLGGLKGLVPGPSAGDAAALKFLKADGSWAIPTSGGGGGGSLQWVEDAEAPTPAVENSQRVYIWDQVLGQKLYCAVKVPAGYLAGNPIKLKFTFYSPATSGNVLMKTVATLIRTGTDAMTSTTNQRTSTNTAATVPGTANVPTAVSADLTSTDGKINSVSVAAGDLILVQLTRDTADTAADVAKVPVYAAEVTVS